MFKSILDVIFLSISFYAASVLVNASNAEILTFGFDIESSCAISVPASLDFGNIPAAEIINSSGYMAGHTKLLPVTVSCSFNPGQYNLIFTGSSPYLNSPDGAGCLAMTGVDTSHDPALGVCLSEDGKQLSMDNLKQTYESTSAKDEHNFDVKLISNAQNNIFAQKVSATLNITLDVP